MGIVKGSCAVVKYSVEGDLPQEDFTGWAVEKLKSHAFRDIDDNYDEHSVGWVSATDMLDSEMIESPLFGDNLVFSLRLDQRKVPASTIKKFCLKEEKRVREEKQIPKLSRGQKLEIKENITMKLIKQVPPTTSVYDIYWNLTNNTVCVMTTNKTAHELFEELFRMTFDLTAVRLIPYTIAENFCRKDLSGVTPVSFLA